MREITSREKEKDAVTDKKKTGTELFRSFGAGNGTQTRDPQLGRLMLYRLSYSRNTSAFACVPLFLYNKRCGRRWIRTTEVERQQIYSLPHLATLVSARYSNFKNLFPPTLSAPSRGPERRRRHRADGGIRTPDQLITNQLLWPTELHRHSHPFGLQK